jgi:transposase
MGLQAITRSRRKKERSAVQHVAIDLGSKESQVCARTANEQIVFERKHPTAKLGELMRSWPPSRVILETSSEAFRIADSAREAGHEVRVVPATLAKQLGVGERGIKTDQRDARQLSKVSCKVDLPSVHIPTTPTRELRSFLRSRETLVETRTKLVNHVRGWMRTQLWKVRTGTTQSFPDRVRGRANEQGIPLPQHLEQVLLVIDALNAQLKEADTEVRRRARESSVCCRLMSIPGVGPITALSFVAAIDDVSRFPSAHRVQSYLGLTPGENSSSERRQRTSITKAGGASVRRTLIQAAWICFFRSPKEPMTRWAKQIAERRGKFIAIVALARKLTGIMFALWRDETSYQATRSAQTPAS